MEFICDVHISFKLVRYLVDSGHAAMHVNELPHKWRTADDEICSFADQQNLIVITKDEDFRNSFFLHRTPKKLVRVVLGNVSNQALIELFSKTLPTISDLDQKNSFYIELGLQPVVYTL